MIDIVMVSYLRPYYTKDAITYLHSRTKTEYNLIVVDNGSDEETVDCLLGMKKAGLINQLVLLDKNYGIYVAKNIGLSLVHNHAFYVDTDNDIFVPNLEPDWLQQQIYLLETHPEYGAIACQPQVFIGGIGKGESDGSVFETTHCGGVMRIMRADLVKQIGGWPNNWEEKRGHEEHYICGEIRKRGLKVGYAENITCFHPFHSAATDQWGYPVDMNPEDHGHKPVDIPRSAGDISLYDNNNWRKL